MSETVPGNAAPNGVATDDGAAAGNPPPGGGPGGGTPDVSGVAESETEPGSGLGGPAESWGWLATRDVEVAPERVAAVAEVLEGQADALRRTLDEQASALALAPPSEDIVSVHAVEAWNKVIVEGPDCYAERVRAYADGLHDLAGRLRAAGRSYTETEEDNTSALAHGTGER